VFYRLGNVDMLKEARNRQISRVEDVAMDVNRYNGPSCMGPQQERPLYVVFRGRRRLRVEAIRARTRLAEPDVFRRSTPNLSSLPSFRP
jgi:hypothetical protein